MNEITPHNCLDCHMELTKDQILETRITKRKEITLQDGRIAVFEMYSFESEHNIDCDTTFINRGDFTEEEQEEIEEFLSNN